MSVDYFNVAVMLAQSEAARLNGQAIEETAARTKPLGRVPRVEPVGELLPSPEPAPQIQLHAVGGED